MTDLAKNRITNPYWDKSIWHTKAKTKSPEEIVALMNEAWLKVKNSPKPAVLVTPTGNYDLG